MTCFNSATCTCTAKIDGYLTCPVHAWAAAYINPTYSAPPCTCGYAGAIYTCPAHGRAAPPPDTSPFPDAADFGPIYVRGVEPTPSPINRPLSGWQCPACMVIHAPHVSSCHCQDRSPF